MNALWSRRFAREGEPHREIRVFTRLVEIHGPNEAKIETPGAGWSFVRAAQAIVALIKDGLSPSDAPGEHRFHPALEVTWNPAELAHPAVEDRIGAALIAIAPAESEARGLYTIAAPLVLLEWPVGFRFGELFERRAKDEPARRALLEVALELVRQEGVRLPLELARLGALTKNQPMLAPLLTLAERGTSFDGWMDVIDLAAAVGGPADAKTLERLAQTRLAADIKDAMRAVARDLKRR